MKYGKIGVGVVTYNREDFFKKCINSIPSVDTLVVVNDGSPYNKLSYSNNINYIIQHKENKTVGVSKNELLRYLILQECEHIFLIEDDMLIINKNIFNEYIKLSKLSGILHLNFGYHGLANKNINGVKNPRIIVNYNDNIKLALNPNCVGAFSYYHNSIIKDIGYIDENFKNCWEHVEHTYRIIKKGYHPPFWWFADLANSDEYVNEQASNENNTTIIRTDEWMQNLKNGISYFYNLHGYEPTKIPNTSYENVIKFLKDLKP